MENQGPVKVHTENIPKHIRIGSGQVFLEAFLKYESQHEGKEENEEEHNQNLCGAL